MKKKRLVLLALLAMGTCAACGKTTAVQTETMTETTTTEAATTEEVTTEAATTEETITEAVTEDSTHDTASVFPDVTVENPVTYFTMTLADDAENMHSLSATLIGETEVTVEYVGEEKKVGSFDPAILHGITAEIENLNLAELHGQDVYGDGEAFASMYVNYEDGSYLSASYSGTIAEEFIAIYEKMEERFEKLTAELPIYEPQPLIQGEVDVNTLTEMQVILFESGIENLDALIIADVPVDEYFNVTMGLSASDGIVNGTSCYPMMSPIAYSCVIATAADAAQVEVIRKDFEDNLDWNKWVCVSASNALIAQKGNMVICLLGTDSWYEQTAQAIENNGWTDILYLTNPNM